MIQARQCRVVGLLAVVLLSGQAVGAQEKVSIESLIARPLATAPPSLVGCYAAEVGPWSAVLPAGMAVAQRLPLVFRLDSVLIPATLHPSTPTYRAEPSIVAPAELRWSVAVWSVPRPDSVLISWAGITLANAVVRVDVRAAVRGDSLHGVAEAAYKDDRGLLKPSPVAAVHAARVACERVEAWRPS